MGKQTMTKYARKFLLSKKGEELIATAIVKFFNDFFMPEVMDRLHTYYPHRKEWKFTLTDANISIRSAQSLRVQEVTHPMLYSFDIFYLPQDSEIRFTLQSSNHSLDVVFHPTYLTGRIHAVAKNEKNIPTDFDITLLSVMDVMVKFITQWGDIQHYMLRHVGMLKKDPLSPQTEGKVNDYSANRITHALEKVVLPWVGGEGGARELEWWLKEFAHSILSAWNARKSPHKITGENIGRLGRKYTFSVEILQKMHKVAPLASQIEIYADHNGEDFSITYILEPPWVEEARVLIHPGTDNEIGPYIVYFKVKFTLTIDVYGTDIKIKGKVSVYNQQQRKEHETLLWEGDVSRGEDVKIPHWDDPQIKAALNSLVDDGIRMVEELATP